MAMTAAHYLQQLQALLPSGQAWPREDDAEITLTLLATAAEYARLDARAEDLLREFHPSTAEELLPEWEAEYDITPPAGATTAQRQAVVAYRYRTAGDIKKPYYIALAATLGFTIRIENYLPPIIGFIAVGDYLYYEPWQEFTAAVSGAGDTLGMAAQPAVLPGCWRVVVIPPLPEGVATALLETTLLDLAPAHIKMNFVYLEA